MKLKELIDYCNALKESKGRFINCIDVDRIIDKIKQLDEPEKVKVPQFVADWIEEAKRKTYNIRGAIEMAQYVRVKDWLELKNVDIFAEAWVNGYEVEEEKRYRVKMKGIVNALSFLSYHKNADIWTVTDKNNSDGHRAHHTRKELEEAGFGWVFDCEGVEVEEVEG